MGDSSNCLCGGVVQPFISGMFYQVYMEICILIIKNLLEYLNLYPVIFPRQKFAFSKEYDKFIPTEVVSNSVIAASKLFWYILRC